MAALVLSLFPAPTYKMANLFNSSSSNFFKRSPELIYIQAKHLYTFEKRGKP